LLTPLKDTAKETRWPLVAKISRASRAATKLSADVVDTILIRCPGFISKDWKSYVARRPPEIIFSLYKMFY